MRVQRTRLLKRLTWLKRHNWLVVPATFLRNVVRVLSLRDRLVLAGLGLVVAGAAGLLLRQALLHTSFDAHRASYTEGMVASSLADVDPTVQVLTHSALLMSDDKGSLTGQLAESWHVSDNAKVFDFTLRPGVDRQTVLDALKPTSDQSPLAGSSVASFDDRGVRITLKDSLAPFIAELTKPIIPIGSFVVIDRTKDHVSLASRTNSVLGAPKLAAITLAIYPTTAELQRAVSVHAVDGVADVPAGFNLPAYLVSDTLNLPRTTAAFFNLDRAVVKDLATRQQLIDKKRFDQPLKLTVVTTETLAATTDVQQLLKDWRAANVQIDLVTLSAAALQQTRLPKRDYDVLIDGIDSGADPDPYPFWHSSQRKATGLNLANFANIDADRLIEAARATGNADQRAKQYDQLNQILDQQKPWLVLNHAPLTFAVDRSLVGPTSHAGFAPTDRYMNIQTWQWK